MNLFAEVFYIVFEKKRVAFHQNNLSLMRCYLI